MYGCEKHETNSSETCGRVDNQIVGRNFNINGSEFHEIMHFCHGYWDLR